MRSYNETRKQYWCEDKPRREGVFYVRKLNLSEHTYEQVDSGVVCDLPGAVQFASFHTSDSGEFDVTGGYMQFYTPLECKLSGSVNRFISCHWPATLSDSWSK